MALVGFGGVGTSPYSGETFVYGDDPSVTTVPFSFDHPHQDIIRPTTPLSITFPYPPSLPRQKSSLYVVHWDSQQQLTLLPDTPSTTINGVSAPKIMSPIFEKQTLIILNDGLGWEIRFSVNHPCPSPSFFGEAIQGNNDFEDNPTIFDGTVGLVVGSRTVDPEETWEKDLGSGITSYKYVGLFQKTFSFSVYCTAESAGFTLLSLRLQKNAVQVARATVSNADDIVLFAVADAVQDDIFSVEFWRQPVGPPSTVLSHFHITIHNLD